MKIADEGSELERQKKMCIFEEEGYAEGFSLIAGVDEAGRGPLAGAVYAAAVILPRDVVINGINDSKKLSEKKRELLFDEIREKAIAYSIYSVDEKIIDEVNILKATHMAMNGAVAGLSVTPELVLIDGNSISGMTLPHKTVVGGDAKSISIAAASILAKVARDRYITELAKKYPEYGFEKHKGYGTRLHTEAILKYGACEIHRKTFLKKLLKSKESER